jgi:hypothetical protein
MDFIKTNFPIALLAFFYGSGLLMATVTGIYGVDKDLVGKLWDQVNILQGAFLGIITDKTYRVWRDRKGDVHPIKNNDDAL